MAQSGFGLCHFVYTPLPRNGKQSFHEYKNQRDELKEFLQV